MRVDMYPVTGAHTYVGGGVLNAHTYKRLPESNYTWTYPGETWGVVCWIYVSERY